MKVLLVGGPSDGQWLMVSGIDRTIVVQEIFNLVSEADDGDMFPKRHLYVRDTAHMFGHSLHVAIHEESILKGMDRDTMLMRTILQRDVAREMGAR